MYFFHQNMRVFGGGVAARNAAYAAQFAATNVAIAAAAGGPIGVGGFTEVVNNGAASVAFGGAGGLCAQLGLGYVASIACGSTVLANGPEYIAIGVNPALAVQRIGRVFLNVTGGAVNLLEDSIVAAPTAAWCNAVPAGATRDYRGLVYVIVQFPGAGAAATRTVCVAFLHNMYTFVDQRILIMGALPRMLNLIANRHGAMAGAFIGGDFNVPAVLPAERRGTMRIGYAYGYAVPLAAAPIIPAPAPTYPYVAGGTTWRGNLYDYWFSTVNPGGGAPPAPLVMPAPMATGVTLDSVPGGGGGLMSDHAGIGLRFY